MRIFIDGTWNTPESQSNVYRMYQKYGGKYYSGPGTNTGRVFEKLPGVFALANKYLGGAFGFGTAKIVDKVYEDILAEPTKGHIDLFGFSRGSAACRMLASKLAKEGIEVRFLGCYDTVGAFGIPINIWPFAYFGINFQEINLFSDLTIHKNVKFAYHARAKDEKRASFQGTAMRAREGVLEAWFKGDHWEIGSGEPTYSWMENMYKQL